MTQKHDVIIIGAGPAGIMAALDLAPRFQVLLLEKGPDIDQRYCPIKELQGLCAHCSPCSMICGWGGAGAFSDGKLTLTPEFGGNLADYIGREKVEKMIREVDRMFLSFGARQVLYGADHESVKEIQRQAATAGLSLIPAQIRHLGTENCLQILKKMRRALDDQAEVITNLSVTRIVTEEGRAIGVETADGRFWPAGFVVCGPGREGSEWFYKESTRLGLKGFISPVDIGLRIEVPAVILEPLTRKIYESKLIYYSRSFDDRVRTFCMNPYGEVVLENNSGLITVNGHSYAEKRTENTNFALLVSKSFTEPFKEPILYGKNVASLANMLGGGVLVQRLGDLQAGRRSTGERIKRGLVQPTLKQATPGDLSLVMPYRHLTSILEMLEALDVIAPGINSRHTLLYGVEVKFYSFRLQLTEKLETTVKNLFAVGDGAGITRGLVQASSSGLVAAREIGRRLLA